MGFSQKINVFVGTYTKTNSEGIYNFELDTTTLDYRLVSTTKTSNPAYITLSNNGSFLYTVNEDKHGKLTAFKIDKTTGELTKINEVDSQGQSPCYITYNQANKTVYCANYFSGNFNNHKVNPDGSLTELIQSKQHTGSSVNKERQLSPHAHGVFVSPDKKFLLVTDLGIDKVLVYPIETTSGNLIFEQANSFTSVLGSGPRHLDFSKNGKYVYLLEELTGTVQVTSFNKGKMTAIQRVSSHPKNYTGIIGSADIHVSPDGNYLYCSNRGDSNTIAIFKINQKNGKLTLINIQSTLGIKPRNFNITKDGKLLLVGNQESNEIVVFKIDQAKGLLADTGKRISVPSPACIQFLDRK